MLAPNGARRTKADHPALPVTIPETVAAAKDAFAVGAHALHAHVRDADARHSLDAGLYRELIKEMERVVPEMPVQITTEAARRFEPDTQRRVVREIRPEGVSVALREMWPSTDPDADAKNFYAWAADEGIAVQHILYTPGDAARLASLVEGASLPDAVQCLFVLGAYAPPRDGRPEDIGPFLDALAPLGLRIDWAACAFGETETLCLEAAAKRGGKIRVGFENNVLDADGSPAADNASRVRQVLNAL
jgi:3-keto-5-aminohexanoate cleavage enzyme